MAFEYAVKSALWVFRQVKYKCLVKSCCSCRSINSGRMKFKGPPLTAYFNKVDNDEHFFVSVSIENESLNLKKTLTFWRRLDTPISQLMFRMNLKITAMLDKKLKKSTISVKPEINTRLYVNNALLPGHYLCANLFEYEGDLILKILEDSYVIVCNAPWVNEIKLPKKILTNSMVLPQKFSTSFTDMESNTFAWYRSEKFAAQVNTRGVHLNDWVQVGSKFLYKVQEEDIGHYLKFTCIPQRGNIVGPEFIEVSLAPVVPSRNSYNFLGTHLLTNEKADDSKIRIVTYNVLADTYATTKEAKTIFDYCSSEVLEKEERYSALSWEVADYNADIVCLQEVENVLHEGYISPRLEENGYDSIFCSKANEREGTACYYNKHKFKIISTDKYTFGTEIMSNEFLKGVHDYLNQNEGLFLKFTQLYHCLQLVVLKPCSRQDQLLLVGNVHLISHPNADLIRLIQIICSFSLYEYTVAKLKNSMPDHKISFILCGDFNSTPDSYINAMVMDGLITNDSPVWKNDEMIGTKGMSYKLPIRMTSAFSDVQFTNYTRTFKGCLDYIYYQTDDLEVNKTYPLPDEEVLSANVGLPSICFPSDHLPLIAELQWKT